MSGRSACVASVQSRHGRPQQGDRSGRSVLMGLSLHANRGSAETGTGLVAPLTLQARGADPPQRLRLHPAGPWSTPGQHPVSIRPAPDQCAGAQGHRFFHGVEALLTRSGHGPHTGRRLSPVDKRGAFLLKNVAERYMPREWPGAGQIGLRLWRVWSLNQGRIRAYCRFWAAARRFSAPTGRGAVAVGGLHGASLFARRVWQMTRHSQPVRGMNEQK